jgi:hypothetical protein
MALLSSNFAKRLAPHIPRPIKFLIKLLIGKYRLVEGPLTYNQDGLATRLNCDFMKDPRFIRSYRAGKETGSWDEQNIHWRAQGIRPAVGEYRWLRRALCGR